VRKIYNAMEERQGQYYLSSPPESDFNRQVNRRAGITGLKQRAHGSRSWIKIDQDGNSEIVTLDKVTIMRHCSLPSRDLRLLDPKFIYPSSILGREMAIVVNLEQIRCIITADEVILMNSLDGTVGRYRSQLCNRLRREKSGKDSSTFCCIITINLGSLLLYKNIKYLYISCNTIRR
jgi:magnesium transporter